MTTSSRRPAARGIFLGAAVGDALGWPQEVRGGLVGGQRERDRAMPQIEFRNWYRSAGHYSSRYRDPVLPGEYSDDTQLFLAVARCCLEGDGWLKRLTEVELPAWPVYQRGGGGAVLSAAGAWAEGRPPWRNGGGPNGRKVADRYRGAGANGVAMRVAPHVLWADGSEDLASRVFRDGLTTHGHPRALVGGLTYAFAMRNAITSGGTLGFGESVAAAAEGLIDADQALHMLPEAWGTDEEVESFARLWQDTVHETKDLLTLVSDSLRQGAVSNPEATLGALGCTDPKVNGAGTVTAVGSIYLASRFAARPESGLLSAAFLRKGDTDTLASMTAGILGAINDFPWMNSLAETVQDSEYISDLADLSASHVLAPRRWPTRRPAEIRRMLRDDVLAGRRQGEFPDGRRYRVEATSQLTEKVGRIRVRLDDGQTAVVDLRLGNAQLESYDLRQNAGVTESEVAAGPDYRPLEVSGTTGESGSDASTTPDDSAKRTKVLPAANLSRSAAFFARLTGHDVPVRNGIARVTPWISLRQAEAGEADSSPVVIDLAVKDLPAAANRLNIRHKGEARAVDILVLQDPDGRQVNVTSPQNDRQADERAGPPVYRMPLISDGPRDRFGLPLNFLGDIDDDFFAATGRIALLGSLVEDRLAEWCRVTAYRVASIQKGNAPLEFSGQSPSRLLAYLKDTSSNFSQEYQLRILPLLDELRFAFSQRNALVHSMWPRAQYGERTRGHRGTLQRGDKTARDSNWTELGENDLANLVQTFVALYERIRAFELRLTGHTLQE